MGLAAIKKPRFYPGLVIFFSLLLSCTPAFSSLFGKSVIARRKKLSLVIITKNHVPASAHFDKSR